jgi:hypothetical protein
VYSILTHLTNAVIFRRENLFSFLRVATVLFLIECLTSGFSTLCPHLGLGINSGLFHSTVTTQTTDLFIYTIGAIVLLFSWFSESTDLLLSVAPSVVVCINSSQRRGKTNSSEIKWDETKNIKDGSRVLRTMYESLPDSDPVKSYLKNNCLHLLSMTGTTGIVAHKDKLASIEYMSYMVDSKDKKAHPSMYSGKSGCYMFECLDTGFQYIGSAICLYTRYKAHKVNSIRPDRGGNNTFYLLVRELGWKRFIWKPILITTNHISKYLQQNPESELGLDSLFILRSFTQFEARIYEQALLTHYRPKLNSGYTVIFSFGNWKRGNGIAIDSSMPLTVEGSNREFRMTYSSKNRAAVSLGIPKTTFDRYINLKNYSVYSPVLDMDVYLIDSSNPMSLDSPKYCNTNSLFPITGVDLLALEKGKLIALCLDKKTVYGVYDNPSRAALSLDGKSECKYIRRYINLERPVKVGPEQEPVFFVMHPEWKTDVKGRKGARLPERKRSSRSKSVVLVNIKDNSALLFETVSDMAVYLGRKASTNTTFVKDYMKPTKLYKNQYEFYYESDFKGTITGKGPKRSD